MLEMSIPHLSIADEQFPDNPVSGHLLVHSGLLHRLLESCRKARKRDLYLLRVPHKVSHQVSARRWSCIATVNCLACSRSLGPHPGCQNLN